MEEVFAPGRKAIKFDYSDSRVFVHEDKLLFIVLPLSLNSLPSSIIILLWWQVALNCVVNQNKSFLFFSARVTVLFFQLVNFNINKLNCFITEHTILSYYFSN